MDLYRQISKGNYYHSLDFLTNGESFPSLEVRQRQAVYRYMQRLYDGSYAKNVYVAYYDEGVEKRYPYKVASINFYKLMINKIDSVLFGNDVLIRSGDPEIDKQILNLIESTKWLKSIRRGVRQAEIFGDVFLKTYKHGVSVVKPFNAFCVVDKHDIQHTIAYVLYEYLFEKGEQNPSKIRFEIHSADGSIYESIRLYSGSIYGGSIGAPINYKYRGRIISKNGNYYETDCNCPLIQKLTINQDADGLYGQSSFFDLKDLVNLLESRLTSESAILSAHEKPILCVDLANTTTNEQTGKRELKMIDDKFLITGSQSNKPEYVTWDGKLEQSRNLREDVLSYIYQLSELGEAFTSGNYKGNISEESLNNVIKSAIDRCNRDLLDFWYEIRNSLYVLCQLNGINVKEEDLSINFNVGRTDDAKTVSEIAKLLIDIDLMSKATILERYFGYDKKAAEVELEQVRLEKEQLKTNGVRDAPDNPLNNLNNNIRQEEYSDEID